MTSKLKRIALIVGGLNRAGLEKVVCDLAHGMKIQGLDVCVFSLLWGPLEEELHKAGIDVVVFAKRNKEYRHNYLWSFWIVLRMAFELKLRKIQVVNIHGLGPERISLLATRLARIPVKTFVFHNNYPVLHPSTGDKKVRQKLIKHLGAVQLCIAISDQVKKHIIECKIVDQKKLSTINNGVNIEKCRASQPKQATRVTLGLLKGDIVIIQVGRFHPQKNQDISVKAMKKVISHCPNAHLLFVGNGPDYDVTKKMAEKSGLLSNIHFLGLRHDVPDLLGASDLFLLPSSWEGLSISLLEAFVNSLPVIGRDVPGIRDVIAIDPACANLVKARVDEALADAIIEAVEDAGWRTKAGAAAFTIAQKHFDFKNTLDSYINLHENLLQNLRL